MDYPGITITEANHKFSVFHGDRRSDCGPVGRDTAYPLRRIPIFRRNLLALSSGLPPRRT
jgi:hypothetical protein